MPSLKDQTITPPASGTAPLTPDEQQPLLEQLDGWVVATHTSDGSSMDTLQKRFVFKDFRAAMAFLRQVEEIAEVAEHHPDFGVHYNKVDFMIWTHFIGGLHMNDFILAARIDALK